MALEVVLWKWLCKNIGRLFLGTNGVDLDESITNMFAKVMIDNVDVFRPWSELRQASKFKSAGVIFKDFAEHVGHRGNDTKTSLFDFSNQEHDGEYVVERLRHGNVLGFGR